MAQAVQALVDTIRSYFQQCAVGRPDLRAAIDHLRAAAGPVQSATAFGQAAKPAVNTASARYLSAALATGTAGPAAVLAAAIAAARGELDWYYGYAPVPDQPDLPDKIAFCEIVGPKARLNSNTTRLGFTLIGPGTHYPAHAHPAVELYHVIAGTARWSTPMASAERPPGSFILHRASEPHAMETAAEPLLALYSWSGDIVAPSRYVSL